MRARLSYILVLAVLLASALFGFLPGAGSASAAETGQAGRVFVPAPPKGKGDKCVEPAEVMRQDHMKFLMHQRDETMHNGIRTQKYSLKECINCHANKDEQGKYVAVDTPGQFCAGCHEYTAVTIDCFSCHSTVPQANNAQAGAAAALDYDAIHAAAIKAQTVQSAGN